MKDYWTAVAEHNRIVNYRKASARILSQAERELLLEFEQIAKGKCERLRRALDQWPRDWATQSR
jgi:hypothetical protein